jgi:hypothetical protein
VQLRFALDKLDMSVACPLEQMMHVQPDPLLGFAGVHIHMRCGVCEFIQPFIEVAGCQAMHDGCVPFAIRACIAVLLFIMLHCCC